MSVVGVNGGGDDGSIWYMLNAFMDLKMGWWLRLEIHNWLSLQGKVRHPRVKEEKKQQSWVVGDVKEPPSPTAAAPPPPNPTVTRPRTTPKPVDEDLYKIPPELLYAKPKKACS